MKIHTPQFTRENGLVPEPAPTSIEGFLTLKTLSDETLTRLGCQVWDETDTHVIWLFPFPWFKAIPKGLLVIDVNGDESEFDPKNSDNDQRFGALPYGFKKEIKE